MRVAVLVGLAGAMLGLGWLTLLHGHAGATTSGRPNVLIFVSDDQTRNTVTPQIMPTLYRVMVQNGEVFPNFTDADPLCCPSRASIMTGRYNHNNHVYSNDKVTPLNIALGSTIQCYLQRAGYRTGLFGKFLNGFPIERHQPCLTDYAINPGQHHQWVPVSINGTIVHPKGWLDEFDLGLTEKFLKNNASRHPHTPWYVYFADSYPHSPYVPRAKYAHTYIPPPPGTVGPAVHEKDVSDKPWFVQAEYGHTLGPGQTLENELKMDRTVDDHFASLIQTLKATGQLKNTLIIYLSDNGYLFGQHGLYGKSLPYTEAINVPFMIRWPDHIKAGSVDDRQAQNIDIAPTVMAATHANPKLRFPYDGKSLLSSWQRPLMLNESFHVLGDDEPGSWQPTWRSIRTTSYQYIEWLNQRGDVIAREYYNLLMDPYQLDNVLGDHNKANNPHDLWKLHAALVAEAKCVGTGCD